LGSWAKTGRNFFGCGDSEGGIAGVFIEPGKGETLNLEGGSSYKRMHGKGRQRRHIEKPWRELREGGGRIKGDGS